MAIEPPNSATFELVWQHDATAWAFVRAADGTCGEGGLQVGEAAQLELEAAGAAFTARRIGIPEVIDLAAMPPGDLALGDSARCAFALVTLAGRTVSEGMVHPQLARGGSSWFAFWGATLDDSLQTELTGVAHALPAVCAEFFLGDKVAAANGLYPQLVDRIARDRLQTAGVQMGNASRIGRSPALESFLSGLSATDPELPATYSYATLAGRISRWVDEGLGEIKEAHWKIGLHLDERSAAR